MPSFWRNMNAGITKTSIVPLLSAMLILLSCSVAIGQAPDKTRDSINSRKTERDRADASTPIIPPAQVYRQFFADMKAGRYDKASNAIVPGTLREIKRDLIRALKNASLEERADFLKGAGFKNAPELQLCSPSRAFVGWMTTGWRIRKMLDSYRQREIVTMKDTVQDNACDLSVEYKPAAKENVTLLYGDRTWCLKLELTLD